MPKGWGIGGAGGLGTFILRYTEMNHVQCAREPSNEFFFHRDSKKRDSIESQQDPAKSP